MNRPWIDEILSKIRSAVFSPGRRTPKWTLSFDSAGIVVAGNSPSAEPTHVMAWGDIVRAIAFKRDLITVDCICVQFTAGDGRTLEANEEMEGWESFINSMPEYLPGSKVWSECFSQVAFPAFTTNETVVFERASASIVPLPGSE
jgi:hypothetical protein